MASLVAGFPLRLDLVDVPDTIESGSEYAVRLDIVPCAEFRVSSRLIGRDNRLVASWYSERSDPLGHREEIEWRFPLEAPIPLAMRTRFSSPGPAEVQLLVTDAPTGLLIWDLVIEPLVVPKCP